MSISFAFDGNDVMWTQRFERPIVYLDTLPSGRSPKATSCRHGLR